MRATEPTNATSRPLLRMPNAAVALAAAGLLALVQAVFLLGFETVLTEPEAAGRPFLIRQIPNGATFSQTVEARANGLSSIRLHGVVAGPVHSAFLDATLVETDARGHERDVRAATAKAEQPCCTIAFAPVSGSAGKRYRIDFSVRDFDASAPPSLWAVPVEARGVLSINGRAQEASLSLGGAATDATAFARLRQGLRGDVRVPLPWLLAGLALLDLAFAIAAVGLLERFATSSDPEWP